MIFLERGVDLVSRVFCFKIENCELRLADFRFIPDKSIGVAEVDGRWKMEESWKNRSCHCRLIGRIGIG
jgi:ferredoxin-thioredoxin reductase catalytic subunit